MFQKHDKSGQYTLAQLRFGHFSTQLASRSLGYREGDFPNAEIQAKRILTLPIHQYLLESQIRKVSETINEFFGH